MKALTLFAFVALAYADTLTLKDGSRIEGTMLSANERTMSFIDNNGARRDYEIGNIREISFARDASGERNRAQQPTGPADTISRLNDDLLRAMDRANLSARQRQMLADAQAVLIRAANDLRDKRNPNNREVRRALDNVRYVMNSTAIRPQDRRAVIDDIAQLREQQSGFRVNR
jgi:hypothetical protein